MSKKDVAIILMTEKLIRLCEEKVFDLKLSRKRPLIVEIPDRHATSQITTAISRYVQDAIGIKI
jgi:V/A-type H+-transporting ATPase subunit F